MKARYNVGQKLFHPYLGNIEIIRVWQENYSYTYTVKHSCFKIVGSQLNMSEKSLVYSSKEIK